jgi:hypothetical protein
MSTEIDFENYKSVELFRRKNLFYKREYLQSIYVAWDDEKITVDRFLKDVQEMDYPEKHKKELIVDTFWFSELVTLIDFLNPIEITFVMAESLSMYNLISENIRYTDNPEEKLFSNYIKIDPKSFDWEVSELNNYKFIISL